MTFREYQYEAAIARLNDLIRRGACSEYEQGVRERWPLTYGQTAAQREHFITDMIIASWSWRF